jgi:thiol-disulfide isomerase/thioredoxin
MPVGWKFAIRALTLLLVLCGVTLVVLLVLRPGRIEPVTTAMPANTAATPALGQFTALQPALPAPTLSFATRDGTVKQLSDFEGKLVLVNLWATWCVPCVKEMPALDRLQAQLGDKLTILAISEDRGGGDVVDPFLTRIGIKNLGIYLDPKSRASAAFAVQGLPTSFLISRDGVMLGKEEGAAEWDGAKMQAVLQGYIDAK